MTRITSVCFALCLLALPLCGQTAPADAPWLELQSATLGLRYRMLENHLGSRPGTGATIIRASSSA